MKKIFKENKTIIIVSIVAMLLVVAFSVVSFLFVGSGKEGSNVDEGIKGKLGLGQSFTIEDIKAYKDFHDAWIDADNNVEIFSINSEGTKEKSENELLFYDETAKTFTVVGVGRVEVVISNKLDKTISLSTELETRFVSNDTYELISSANSELASDGLVTADELTSIKWLTISKPSLDGADIKYLSELERIELTLDDVVAFTALELPQSASIYVPITKYSEYMSSTDEIISSYADRIFIKNQNEQSLSVIMHKNGGMLTDEDLFDFEAQSVLSNETIDLKGYADRISKEGYTFKGWYIYNGDSYERAADAVHVDKDTKIYAEWIPNSYTVILNHNNNTDSKTKYTFTYDSKTVITEKLPKYTTYDENNAVVEYILIGWATRADAKVVNYQPTELVENLTAEPNGTVELYAIWATKTYIVEYYNWESEKVYMSLPYDTAGEFDYDQAFKITLDNPPSDPSKQGDFIGFATTPNAVKPEYQIGDTIGVLYGTPSNGGVVKLYAIYSNATYTISFYESEQALGNGDIPIKKMENTQKNIPLHLYRCDDAFGKKFIGWKDMESSKIYYWDESIQANENYIYVENGIVPEGFETKLGAVELCALWETNSFTINFVDSNAEGIYESYKATVGQGGVISGSYYRTGWHYNSLIVPSTEVNIISISLKNNTISADDINKLYELLLGSGLNQDFDSENAQITLRADLWLKNTYDIEYNLEGGTGTADSQYDILYGENVTLHAKPERSGYTFKGWECSNGNIYSAEETVSNLTTAHDATVTMTAKWEKDGSCVVEGTEVTMADGSVKKVEQLAVGDSILVFNHETGKLDCAPVVFIFSGRVENHPILTLSFANGVQVKVVNEHGFFDTTRNEYVMLNYYNASDYIGDSFYHIEYAEGEYITEKTQLVGCEITYETTTRYTFITAKQINHVVSGMLAVSDEIEGLFNVFELDSSMKIDEAKMLADIEKYGIADYSDWSEYLTEEEFYAFNGQFVNVSIGKGLTTREELIALIQRYLHPIN